MSGRRKESQQPQQGYDACFDPELDKKYQCPICLAALRDPVQTKCGHRFCKICLKGVCSTKRFVKCPVDNTWFDATGDVFEDNAVKREVMSLPVRCLNRESEGCDWTGELLYNETHTETCPFTSIQCINKCGKKILRQNLDSHMTDCLFRLETCQHCDKQVVYAELTKHQLLLCMKFPVNCAICGETGILRDEIPQHVSPQSGDCPLVTVDCRFKGLGCLYQDKRTNMAEHYKNSSDEHVSLVVFKLGQQSSQISSLQQELTESNVSLSNIFQKCQDQSRTIQDLETSLSHQKSQQVNDYNGRLLWKVKLSHRKHSLINSPGFYTGSSGHKIHACLEYTDPPVDGSTSMLSITMISEPGKFNGQIKDSFDGICRVTIYDQTLSIGGGRNVSRSMVCNQSGSSIDKNKLDLVCLEDLFSGTGVYVNNGHAYILIEMITSKCRSSETQGAKLR